MFAYHGYPWLIHRLTYRRTNHHNLHVRGFVEEGTTTTPFDMCVLNRIDRFNLAMAALDFVPRLHGIAAHAREALKNKLIEHTQHIRTHGEDLPEIQIGRAHVCTPVTNAHLVCRLLLEKKKN